jgi:hypothetical protein
MAYQRILRTILLVLILIVTLHIHKPQHSITAQNRDDEPCDTLIEDALQLVGTACVEMGRNEACYGNNAIEVELQADVTASFEDSGDLVEVGDLVSLVTAPANPDAGTWGIAFMAVQADLPDDSDENVTFVLIGDVEVSHDEAFEDEGTTQAFVLESQEGEMCEGAPDGMLIQSPEGERARIVVNGVELQMSSAVFLTAEADDLMGIQGLEGQIDVTADGQTESLTAGFQTTVPLDGLIADGAPTPPEPIPVGDEFPLDIQTTLLAVAGGEDLSSSAGTTDGSGQTFSDEFATFALPEGWLAVRLAGDIPIIAFSNNADYLNSIIAEETIERPIGTLYGTVRPWSWLNNGTTINNSSADEAVRNLASGIVIRDYILEGPSVVTIGDHTVTMYTNSLINIPTNGYGITYGFGDYLISITLVGDINEFLPLLGAMIASFD